MLVKDILSEIDFIRLLGDENVSFNSLSFDSRKCKKDSLFFCVVGEKLDGHNFAFQAVENGATVLVVEEVLNAHVCQIVVKNCRKAMAQISRLFYGKPDEKLKMIAITGTNGKTTTSYIIKHILEFCGKKVGVIGTNGYVCSDFSIEANLTTPDSIELFCILDKMASVNVEYVVMEVSAHAIALNKIYGLNFLVGIFTNLTQDHLDFFGDIDTYFEVKKAFIEGCKFKLINNDDERVKTITGENVYSFALNNPADCFAMDLKKTIKTSEFTINLFDNVSKVLLNLPSEYNVSNCIAACSCCLILKLPFEKMCESLSSIPKILGRVEIVKVKDFTVIIDYAHTPDGIEKILTFAQEFKKNKIISLIGCGGFRDSLKRQEMGILASKLSDICVVTTDNPRYENEDDIVEAISKGVKYCECIKQPDRFKAVVTALMQAKKDDIVVLCGKGRENYQDIKGDKIPYSEYDIVMNFKELKVGESDD